MAAKKTVLLVDDDNQLRGALAEQFGLHDAYETRQADNATDGIKIAESERIDLVLLDVELPDMDGREACKLMRVKGCLLYTSPSPRDATLSRMPSSA